MTLFRLRSQKLRERHDGNLQHRKATTDVSTTTLTPPVMIPAISAGGTETKIKIVREPLFWVCSFCHKDNILAPKIFLKRLLIPL